MSYQRVTEPKLTDDLLLFRDNCFVLISYEDFIKDQVLGGFNVCEDIQNCFESSNCFDNVTPEPEEESNDSESANSEQPKPSTYIDPFGN